MIVKPRRGGWLEGWMEEPGCPDGGGIKVAFDQRYLKLNVVSDKLKRR